MSELHTEVMGVGERVILVHGSLATGREEWWAQQPLADEGFQLVIVDRRGYGDSPPIDGEDFLVDADDIAELLGDGAHLVAHSYGGLGAMLAAARLPGSVRSLTLLEPPAFGLTADEAAATLVSELRAMWDLDLPDDVWLAAFLRAVGTDPEVIPPEARRGLEAMVPLLRDGRRVWEFEVPAELAGAEFPKLVVSGGHHDGFESICDQLAQRIGASRATVEGAGHEIQFTGQPLNEKLLEFWRGTRDG
ncbi:MAG: alpha/beta fold hydrolase [Acidimicrobiia bacterium]|nr:alpha/beta fold hydrolase [Acidimicrobiia bacterium]